MSKGPFLPSEFVSTKFSSAADKADFGNSLLNFLDSGCPQELFTTKLYHRLSMSFGHIAHYDRSGFYDTWFTRARHRAAFVEKTLRWPCHGDSSGNRIRKGGITKAGNAHLRRIVMESAWCYRHLPRVGLKLRKRHEGIPAEIIEIAWKAQNRLHKRYRKLTGGQGSEESHNRSRTGTAGLYLGHRG